MCRTDANLSETGKLDVLDIIFWHVVGKSNLGSRVDEICTGRYASFHEWNLVTSAAFGIEGRSDPQGLSAGVKLSNHSAALFAENE